jgi:protein PhnA
MRLFSLPAPICHLGVKARLSRDSRWTFARRTALPAQEQRGEKPMSETRDSNGAILNEGDNVTLIKDLKVKGSSTVLKRGTMVRGIHLTDDPEEIEGRTDKVKGLVLKASFLKKA